MYLSPDQVEELLSIIDRYTYTFIAHKVPTNVLSAKERDILVRSGVSLKIPTTGHTVSHAFRFGLLSTAIDKGIASGMNYIQLKHFIETGKIFPLNQFEKNALRVLNNQLYTGIKQVGSKIKTQVSNQLVFADKANHTVKYSKVVIDAAKKTIQDRKSLTSMISDIGHMTGSWDKDFGRMSDFVLHSAFDEGRASGYIRQGGLEVLVYKDVYGGACKNCVRLLLTGGIGSQPKIFKLSDLMANGTNIGKKVADWKAVVGPIHPWCRCSLNNLPQGFTLQGLASGEWEWKGGDFRRVKLKRKVKRNSKISVTINGKETKV